MSIETIQVNLNTGFLNSPDKDITIKFTPRWSQTTRQNDIFKWIIPQNKDFTIKFTPQWQQITFQIDVFKWIMISMFP